MAKYVVHLEEVNETSGWDVVRAILILVGIVAFFATR